MSQPKQNLDKKLVYPPGVKDITEDISTDDLIRRLKECVTAFQNMNQDDDNSAYIPLALHLPAEYFMEHNSQEVRILTACCIADVFRVFAPDAPYKDPFQLKAIFEFFVNQLKGLNKSKDDNFKRYYFYLLENLSWVKTFNICLELEDNQTILSNLFKLMFSIISDDQSTKMKHFILDLLTPLINEADVISQELLELILSQIIDPRKSQNKSSYTLAKDLLKKTSTFLEPYIQAFFNNALILGKTENKELAAHLYDLIYELNGISENMLVSVLPQLDFKLKSSDDKERSKATEVLAKLFSEKGSTLAHDSKLLWHGYIGRFNDISAEVRGCVVRSSMDFLVNHPELREDIIEQLRQRLHDNDENVRYEVVRTIINAGRRDFNCINNELLEFVKERTLDKKFKTRKEALLGLAMIYKEQEKTTLLGSPEMESILWIRNKVLHLYYQTSLDDKLLVERILLTCLLPYQYAVEERMRKLYHLVTTVDSYAYRALQQMLRTQSVLRGNVRNLVEITSRATPVDRTLLQTKISNICRELPEPKKAHDHILKFCQEMESSPKLRNTMFVILNGNALSAEVERNVKVALKSLGTASATNPYYMIIKQLLERVAPIMIDKQGVRLLVQFIYDTVLGPGNVEMELGISNSCERNLPFLQMLSKHFPAAFKQQEVFEDFLLFLQSDDEVCASYALQILMETCSDLEVRFPDIAKRLIPLLENFAETGTVKQAKSAIYCLNNFVSDKVTVFGNLLENLKKHFTLESQYFRTALVSIGHIAFLCSCLFSDQFKKIISDVVVKNLLELDQELPRGGDNDWGPLETLPEETKVKIAGMKFMIRWLLGLKHSVKACNCTLRLLNKFIVNEGDLMERQHTAPQENSWLRLTAAVSIVKLCKERNYIDTLTPEQFQVLASVVNDPCPEVRERFVLKLHKSLISMKLPLEFMAIFAYCGLETKKELKETAKSYLALNVRKRKELGKHQPKQKLLSYLPDYILPYTIYMLAHSPFYEKHDDIPALRKVETCLWFIMEHLVTKNESYSFSFLKRLLEIIKQSRDRLNPDNQEANSKLYAVTDLATSLLVTKTTNIILQDFPVHPVLPSKLFTAPDKGNTNSGTYLPEEIIAPFMKDLPTISSKLLTLVGMYEIQKKTSKFDFNIFVGQDSLQKIDNEEISQTNEESVDSMEMIHSRTSRKDKDASKNVTAASQNVISTTNLTVATVTKECDGNEHNHSSADNETCIEIEKSDDQMLPESHHVFTTDVDEPLNSDHSHLSSVETSETVKKVDSKLVNPTVMSTMVDVLDKPPGGIESLPPTRHKTLRLRSKRFCSSEDIPLTTLSASKKLVTTSQNSVPLNLLKDCNASITKQDLHQNKNSLPVEKRTTAEENGSDPLQAKQNNSKKSYVTRAARQNKNENISEELPTTNHRSFIGLSNNKQNIVEAVPTKQLRNRAAKESSVAPSKEAPKPVKRTRSDLKGSPPTKRVTRQTDGLLSVNKKLQNARKNTKATSKKKKKA